MNVREYIKENILLFDGAMGTYYAKTAKAGERQCELANLTDRDTVVKIHKGYCQAGCRALKTNTFLANPRSLSCTMEQTKQVIAEGWRAAQEAAGDAFVFADIGPIPQSGEEDLYDMYRQIADCFLEQGAENFLFETFGAPVCLPKLFTYIKSVRPQGFIAVSFAVLPGGCTRQGIFGAQLYRAFSALKETDAVGFNCVCGPYHLRRFIESLDNIEKPLLVMPNAGYPGMEENRTVFPEDAGYFAGEMEKIAACPGVKIIGGCCGTTPDLLRGVREKLSGNSRKTAMPEQTEPAQGKTQQSPEHIAPATGNAPGVKAAGKQASRQAGAKTEIGKSPVSKTRNRLAEKLAQGKRVIAVEVDPPLDRDGSFFMEAAGELKALGVDAVTIADCPVSRARADSSLLACKLRRELDMDPIPHMTCRDRNINATKALLLGLSMEGVNNVLAVTGDPIPAAGREEIKGVYNFNAPRLAGFIQALNQELVENPFQICGALNINAVNFTAQLAHARRKMENGVTVFLTQPVLSRQAVENLKIARKELDAKLLGGILPIVSHRNACYMNSQIAGITVGPEIIALYEGLEKEAASDLAVRVALGAAREIAPYTDGYYLITPFKRIDLIRRIIQGL